MELPAMILTSQVKLPLLLRSESFFRLFSLSLSLSNTVLSAKKNKWPDDIYKRDISMLTLMLATKLAE